MLRRNDLPNRFQYRGEELLFHRLADGPALGRLDPYADGEQIWPMLNGHDIAVTAEEIRDITRQVYGITLPPLDPLKALVVELEERVAKLEARKPLVEKVANVEVPAAVVDAAEWPDLNEKLSDWDEVGHGAIASNIPAAIAELMEPGETLTHDVRRKLTERLNVELAELKNLRGLAGEDLKREAEIEKLLGLFARLGEI